MEFSGTCRVFPFLLFGMVICNVQRKDFLGRRIMPISVTLIGVIGSVLPIDSEVCRLANAKWRKR